MHDCIEEQCSPPTSLVWRFHKLHILNLSALTLMEPSFPKCLLTLSFILYGKLLSFLQKTVLHVMLLLQILSNNTPVLGSNASLSLPDTTLLALIPLPTYSGRKKSFQNEVAR